MNLVFPNLKIRCTKPACITGSIANLDRVLSSDDTDICNLHQSKGTADFPRSQIVL